MSVSADIGVVYFDGGTAHRSTTFALVETINRAAGRRRAEVVDALEVFRCDPAFSRIVGTGIEFFNGLLRGERVFALKFWLKVGIVAHDTQSSERAVARMSRYFEERPYRVLVSTIPIYNEVLYRALRRVRPDAIGVTAVVDFDEPLLRYWFSPRAGAQHYLCYNDVQLEQARERDPAAEAHRIGGPIVHPDFDPSPLPDGVLARLREERGLPADRPVGLLSFGGQGSSRLRELGRRLDDVGRDFSAIYVCGRDRRTFEALSAMPTHHPKAVLGFSNEMPKLLRIADFFVGKPGPASIAESIVSGTPPILFRSRGMRVLLGRNEDWIEREGLGALVAGVDEVPAAIRRVLDDPSIAARVRAHSHRGVHEAAEIIRRLAGDAASHDRARP